MKYSIPLDCTTGLQLRYNTNKGKYTAEIERWAIDLAHESLGYDLNNTRPGWNTNYVYQDDPIIVNVHSNFIDIENTGKFYRKELSSIQKRQDITRGKFQFSVIFSDGSVEKVNEEKCRYQWKKWQKQFGKKAVRASYETL